MTDAQMAKYLIARHAESGDPFAGDVGEAPGSKQVHDFPVEGVDPFAGDVGTPAGRDSVSGFPPAPVEGVDPFAGDLGLRCRSSVGRQTSGHIGNRLRQRQ